MEPPVDLHCEAERGEGDVDEVAPAADREAMVGGPSRDVGRAKQAVGQALGRRPRLVAGVQQHPSPLGVPGTRGVGSERTP